METIVTSPSTWIVETISRVWEAMMECFLILSLNYIRNINLFLFSFLKYRDFMFFVISIFVVVKDYVVNSKCILCYFWYLLIFFGVFIRAILEQVCQSFNIYNAEAPSLSYSETIFD